MSEPILRRAALEELPAVSALAGRIWRAHYPSILTGAQIEYMLALMYGPARLRADVERGVVYELLFDGERAIGFCGYEAFPDSLKLHKLYLEVSDHGRGLGSMMLGHVEEEARRRGLPKVVLGVNRLNAKALRAYQRNGYSIREELKTEIGGGFVMDDYILEKAV
jgi:ribosomal protein S18 acetylase RimI-like enzyme